VINGLPMKKQMMDDAETGHRDVIVGITPQREGIPRRHQGEKR
jgi:hypothetical protein